jgi:hypothetical protein
VTTPEPTTAPSATPEIPPVTIISSADLAPGQVVLQYDASETTLGLRWWRVTTSTLTFVMPESWSLRDVSTDADGLAVLPTEYIFVETNVDGIWLVVSTVTGEVASIDPSANLRGEGASGKVIDPATLARLFGSDSDWASIYNMLSSVTLVTSEAPATATPTATPTSGSAEPTP